MANDNKLDEEQQLGVIAAHKSKFTAAFVKGPTAVKETMKAKLFGEDAKHGPTPTRLL